MMNTCFCLAIFLIGLKTTSCQEHEIVQTASGKVRGVVKTDGDEKVYTFLGIPYAKPPVGELRFRKPKPFGSWDYTLDATKDTSPCMQIVNFGGMKFTTSERISEDCLFLNIHVPREISASSNKAVMVWIHGGGFLFGEGAWYDGSKTALNGDVIVVTVNYRLGIFGFYTTFDQAARGNYGLWDQIMAIEWVRSNIAAFGGNPSSITIYGESAGGMSVSYQSIIPYNKGLFQRVIAQSGTALSAPLMTNSTELVNTIVEKTHCKPDTYQLVECLRQMSSDQLLNVSTQYFMNQLIQTKFSIVLGPSVDGDLFKDDPENLLFDPNSEEYKFFKSLDYMAGTTDGEGTVVLNLMPMFSEQLKFNLSKGIPTRVVCDVFSHKLAEIYYKNATGSGKALCEKYKVDGGDSKNQIEQGVQFANMYGDLFFVSPTVKTLDIHEKDNNKKTFQYLFTRAFMSTLFMTWPEWFKQSGHASELLFLFGIEQMFDNFNLTLMNEDLVLAEHMLTYWTNFAKTGNPNSESLPVWKEYSHKQDYLHLDHKITSGDHLYTDRINFLQREMPKFVEKASKKEHEEL